MNHNRWRTPFIRRLTACLLGALLLCSAGFAMAGTINTQTMYDDLLRQEQSSLGAQSAPPACDGPAGCVHVDMNAQGQLASLCALGRWYMANGASGTLFSASRPADLTLINGHNDIDRSGTYLLSGGGSAAELTIWKTITAALGMGTAQLNELNLLAGASASLSSGAAINTLTAQGSTLYVDGQQSFTTITGDLTLTGSGTVNVGDLSGVTLNATPDSNIRVIYTVEGASTFTGWQKLSAPASQTFTNALAKATYLGVAVPFCFIEGSSEAYFRLDTSKSYMLSFSGDTCEIQPNSPAKPYELTSGSNPLIISSTTLSGPPPHLPILKGSGGQDVEISDISSLTISSVNAHGSVTVNNLSTLNLTLSGSSSFYQLTLAPSAARTTISGSGCLKVDYFTDNKKLSIDPNTNFRIKTSPPDDIDGKQSSRVRIMQDAASATPVKNTPVILTLGNGDSFQTTTDDEGYITLWRQNKLNKVSVTALTSGDTYTAVLMNGDADADALPDFTSLTTDASGNVTVKTTNAKTIGVQYIISNAAKDSAPAYDDNSAVFKPFIYASGSSSASFTIPGIKSGDVITLYVFAAKEAGQKLTPATKDAFRFSKKLVISLSAKKPFHLDDISRTYSGGAVSISKSVLPTTATVTYYSEKAPNTAISAPITEGRYFAKIKVEDSDPVYNAGVYTVSITIHRMRVYVYPLPNMKTKGEVDPPLMYMTDPLIGNDQVEGRLRRMEGEGYGNYPYYADLLYAVDGTNQRVSHYSFVIAPESDYFFINWNRHHYIPLDPLSVINPVYDELRFGNGKILKVQSRTSDTLTIGDTHFGTLVVDTATGDSRPFTPSLRLRQGQDEALIILTADAELNKDGGYETDRDGNRQWRSRTLILGYYHINQFKAHDIYDIAFSLRGTTVMLSLQDLIGPAMEQLLADNGLPKVNTRFYFELTPVDTLDALTGEESSAQAVLTDGQQLMRLSAYLKNGQTTVDISSHLPSAKLLVDAGGLMTAGEKAATAGSDITETVNGKPVKPASSADSRTQAAIDGVLGGEADDDLLDLGYRLLEDRIAKNGYALRYYQSAASALDSSIVLPYTASESNIMPYSALMRIRPFLIAPFSHSGLYGLNSMPNPV